MEAPHAKKKMVYLFFVAIAVFAATDLFLNEKLKTPPTSTPPQTSAVQKKTPIRPAAAEAEAPAEQDAPSQSHGVAAPVAPKAQQPGHAESQARQMMMPVKGDALALAKAKNAEKLKQKMARLREKQRLAGVGEGEGASRKQKGVLKGALVIYNRVPEAVRVSVTGPDGKRVEKTVQSLKSFQIEVPMGTCTIQAYDLKNNAICNGKVTVNDELGAAYYVKL